jgi:hypothetical protein
MDIRPDVLPFSHHAGLTPSQAGFDESGNLLRMDILDAQINELASGDAIDSRGHNDVSLHVAY